MQCSLERGIILKPSVFDLISGGTLKANALSSEFAYNLCTGDLDLK